jgi:hypothetical protein
MEGRDNMEHLRTGRFGRITKNIIGNGFEGCLDEILGDSTRYTGMDKKEKAEYIRAVIERMEDHLGRDDSKKVMSDCGKQCCGKSWSNFIRDIWDKTGDMDRFFELLNIKERNYGTEFVFDKESNTILIERNKCICGLVEKARYLHEKGMYCECSTGHFREFFGQIFIVEDVLLKQSILSGSNRCRWEVDIRENIREDTMK